MVASSTCRGNSVFEASERALPRPRFRVVAIALLLFALADAAGGEEPPAPIEAAPLAIPTAMVADRADALSRDLRRTRERIAPSTEVETIVADLVDLIPTLEGVRETTSALLAGQPTLAALAESERDWDRLAAILSRWRRDLTRRAAALDLESRRLEALALVWRVTLESATASGAPPELLEATLRVIDEMGDVREETRERLASLLSIQNRVAQREIEVSESVESVRGARTEVRKRILEPDTPPLWSSRDRGQSTLGERVSDALLRNGALGRHFLGNERSRLGTLGLFFVLAWISAVGLRRSVDARRDAGAEIAHTSRVFQRPLSLAILVTLLLVFWLFPLAPASIYNLVGLLLIVPMLRLLPKLMSPSFRPVLYGVAAFYVVDRLRGLLVGADLDSRVVFAAECAAASLCCLALLRPSRLARVSNADEFPGWLNRAVQAGVALFAAAVVANVLGYVSLALLLGEGPLVSIYIAIGVYAALQTSWVILDVTSKTQWAQRIHFLRRRRKSVLQWMKRAITFVAAGFWAYWSLGALALRDPVLDALSALLTASLTLGTASVSLGDVVSFGLTVTAAIWIARFVQFILMEDVFPRLQVARGIPHAVSATAQYAILFSGFMLALAAAGIDFSKFSLLVGAFGVGIGFGLQNVVNNFVSGIILLYERPIQVGDAIDMGDLIGEVKRIGIRSSTVRTFNGSEVIVPNADLVSQRVINWTLTDNTRRIDVPIGVKYGTDPDVVIAILLKVARTNDRVLNLPAPQALFRAHGESSLDFELRIWIANFDEWFQVESQINTSINHALAEAGIEIPFPQRDLHVRSLDAEAAERLGSSS
jgi:potassium efflux system protein